MTVTEYVLPAPIPERVRIAHISDLHNAPFTELLGALESLAPDCAALTGDIAENLSDVSQSGFEFMRKAASLCPCFFTPGNHERYDPHSPLQRENVESTGVRFLRYTSLEFRGIAVGGIPSGFECRKQGKLLPTPPPDADWIAAFSASAPFTLLLSHHPEYFTPYIAPRSVSLTLSGHAHGGQIRLFGHGLFAPGQGFLPKFTSGLHTAKSGSKLIVSRGLSNNAPFPRIFNDTELVMITLEPEAWARDGRTKDAEDACSFSERKNQRAIYGKDIILRYRN